jgi:hypothetical protein
MKSSPNLGFATLVNFRNWPLKDYCLFLAAALITAVSPELVLSFHIEENHVLCNWTKNDYMSYATQKQLQRPYIVLTLTSTGL